jgi:hypothetical protein
VIAESRVIGKIKTLPRMNTDNTDQEGLPRIDAEVADEQGRPTNGGAEKIQGKIFSDQCYLCSSVVRGCFSSLSLWQWRRF